MAKIAVLFFAALAFQAAFAGVHRHHHHHDLNIEDGKSGQLDEYVGQIQSVASDLSATLQGVLPNNRLVAKTLIWQNRELAPAVEQIISRLQVAVGSNTGDVDITLQQVINELREIQVSLQQTVGYTDVSNVSQLKNQLNTNVQTVVEQLEKLVQKVLPESQGSLHATLQSVLADWLNIVQTIRTQVQSVGQDIQGEQSPRQLGIQIEEITGGLTVALQNANLNTQQVKIALREYAQNVETIVGKLQGELTVGNKDVDIVLQQLAIKLRQLLLPLEKITGLNTIVNVNGLGAELTGDIQNIAVIIEQLVQAIQTGSQQLLADNLVLEVINDYLYTIHQARIQIQGGSEGGLYSKAGLQGGLYSKSRLQGGLYGKSDLQAGLYSKSGLQGGLYGKSGLQGGLYGKSGLQGGLYEQSPYQVGVVGKEGKLYQSGLLAQGKSGKGLALQIQSIAGDLSAALQNVYVDNALVQKTLITLIREYVRNLELIVERLEQVNYSTGVSIVTPQKVAQNLRQIVLSLEQLIGSGVSVNAIELRNKLSLYVQNIATELGKLSYGAQSDLQLIKGVSSTGVRDLLIQFLTITRNLQVQILNISQVAQHGQTSSGFGIQIQTLANGLTATLQSVSVDNIQARQILVQQSRELAQYLETIVQRLQSVSYASVYTTNLPQQVAANLRQIIVALQQVSDLNDVTSAQKLKLQLVAAIQEAATEIQKLLWLGQQGQGQILSTGLYSILNDFVAVLQNQQIALQSIYQSSQYGQSTQQLVSQIQAITNNLAIFLQNVPSNGEQVRQQLEIQARKLARNIESIIERLEVEGIQSSESGLIQKVVIQLRQIVQSLEQVAVYETSSSVYQLTSRFNLVLQNVASELRKLAYVAPYGLQIVESQGNWNGVIRSVLVQYLVVIQQVQVQLQGINQTVQIGQTPRELALQIQVVAQRLVGLLRVVVPDNKQTENALVYQVRRLSQIIEIIVNKLQIEISRGNGNIVLQKVISNLNQIQVSLQQAVTGVDVVSTYQLKYLLAARIQDAAIEIQKLIFVGQSDVQGGLLALVRGVLIDFLDGLQNLQVQIQDNLQIVLNGQNPRALAIQIQSIANRLAVYLQYVQPNSLQLKQTLTIQIGELTQTIENVIQLLQAEIKNNGVNTTLLKQVITELNKISLALQQLTGTETTITVTELTTKLNLIIQNVVSEIQKLAYVAQYQIQQTQIGTYHNGVLNGVFNNILATLRNILIQLQNTRQIGLYGQSVQELGNQIQTITGHLSQSLELVGATSKQVKQALAIQALKFARRIQNIVDRLETEVSYNSEINVNAPQQIVQNLKQVVVALQQIGGSLTTSTTVDLRTQLNAQIQNAGAQIQKLLLAQSGLQQSQSYISTLVRSVLIDYLAAVQNLQIRVQSIAKISQKGQDLYQLAIQVETAVIELFTSFQRVLPTNRLVGQTISVEARELAQVIASIVNKLQSVQINGIVQEVIEQLKQIELQLQQIVGVETLGNVYQQKIQLEVYVQRVAALIERLVWAVQPEIQQVQVGTGIVTVVREILLDFLAAIQNVHIQIQNVVQTGQIRQFSWGLGLQGQSDLGLQKPVYGGLGLQKPIYGELGLQKPIYGGLGLQRGLQGQLGLERVGDLDEQYYGGLGLQRQGLGLQGLSTPYARQGLVGGQIYGSQIGQSPRQILIQIEDVVRRLSGLLQSSVLNGQQAKEIVVVQARQLVQIIETIIDELQEVGISSGSVDSVLQPVIIRLREVQKSLKRIVSLNTFTTVYQLKSELDTYIQTIVAQIEKLVYIVQQVPQGNLNLVITRVLGDLLRGIEHVLLQIQSVAQYGGQYGLGYGSQLRQLDQYGQGYGLQGLTGLKYGYQGQSVSGLIGQIQMLSSQIVVELQTAGINNGQIKQIVISQARQLLQVIDNVIDRLQSELGSGYGYSDKVSQKVLISLRQIQVELQQVVSAGVLTTVYQIKGQFVGLIQTISAQLKKLALIVESDIQSQGSLNVIVKDVLVQYLAYLRSIESQLQGSTLGLQGNILGLQGNTLGLQRNILGLQGNTLGLQGNTLGLQGNTLGLRGNTLGLQGLTGLKYGYQGQSVSGLIGQIQMLSSQIVVELQTAGINNGQIKQIVISQARQLLQVIDNVIDRLQSELGSGYGYSDKVSQKVLISLRQIQVELQQVVSAGVLTTVYQIKGQFVGLIQTISAQLKKLALIVESDIQSQGSLNVIVKDVLVQYLAYLRSIESQLQGSTLGLQGNILGLQGNTLGLQRNILGLQGNTLDLQGNTLGLRGNTLGLQGNTLGLQGSTLGLRGNALGLQGNTLGLRRNTLGLQVPADLVSQLQILVSYLRELQYIKQGSLQGRELVQNIEAIIYRIESLVNGKEGYVLPQDLLYKLKEIAQYIQGSQYDLVQGSGRLSGLIPEVVAEIQSWIAYQRSALPVGLSGRLWDAKDYVRSY